MTIKRRPSRSSSSRPTPVCASRLVTARYFMPVSAILALILGLGLSRLWERGRAYRLVIAVGLAAWLLFFALPFMLSDPLTLDFGAVNYHDFQAGFLTADDRLRETAAFLTDTAPGTVYATEEACQLLFFYSDGFDMRCLPQDPAAGSAFGEMLLRGLAPGETAYLVISWYYGPFHLGIPWLESEEIPLKTPPRFLNPGYEFRAWRIQIKTP